MTFKYHFFYDYDNNNVNRRFLKRIILTIIIIVICVFTLLTLWKQSKDPENAYLIIAKHGAVASELINCSHIGVDVLKEGGSAVDAAIATELCVGTINAFSAGIGGGGLMLIHLPNGTAEFIDCRETAPHIANKRMFIKNPNSASIGGLSIGVPGEISGMKIAHERYGKLPWKRLFEPSIKLSRDGFPVDKELDIRLKMYRNELEQDPALSAIYAPSGKLLEKGEIVYRRNFSRTLELISENYTEFYEGSIARSLINEINGRGGIMSFDDFKNYKTIIREPVIGYYHGKKIITTSEPTSGPPLIFMLNLLENYEMSDNGLDITNLHRIVETMKFGFARRTELGDPEYFRDQFEHETRIREIISKEYAALVRANVSDDQTFNPDYYNPIFDHKDDHGTTHISVMDKNDMAVSFTSTVNLIWGSRVLDPITGILLNDEMDDFSIPGAPNHFGLRPSPYNFVAPGKRPLSSTVPTIVENENGKVELVTGGSGGSKILSAVLQVLLNLYDFDMSLLDAINSPRVHHQLLPNLLGIEQGLNLELVDKLLTIGHVIQLYNIENREHSCQVNAIRKFNDGTIHAVSDYRKSGVFF
ncbi:gamma-glutamyltranspeptidase [Gigaspora margarita]|uniref:Glutathione hydrolase n=1 Tax=Gigaspora margarita TaxID=4874 RepID=A0A8H3XAU7_GIGMA|nr:gamma-glutamyltranspeptidase [Gigaspora margarita]